MGRTAGVILIFLGVLLLMKEFRPAFIIWLEPYREVIRNSLGGVTLIAAGSYLLARGSIRRIIALLYVIYLALYLVV
ncbi:hypothetical protein [Thermococcus gorgonarius]|uniref:Uncharacterized protein n=1 Tax=Thermococcus gorgonarius TaxID=71997 RepID=A0A2Z2MAH8_THEGO|nr:hypothetical protein [Thermococcus gorgonarius]ASJ00914.1 hypothetical protein A3K92_05175 [Thermococcus gorgonarius]